MHRQIREQGAPRRSVEAVGDVGRSGVLSGIVVAFAITLLSSGPALAGRLWCAGDPILEFNDGTRVQWMSRFYADYLGSLTGPVTYWIEVPENAGPIKVSFPASAVREQVTISYSGDERVGQRPFEVRAYVTVNASAKFTAYTSVRGNLRSALDDSATSGKRLKLVSVVDRTYWHALEDTPPIVTTKTFTRTATTVGP
ncbi:MAG: hypothetical protein M3T56_08295 [Chloroflexota bacterium]|nr:hypothetical protein [Chloroflexota bacterium]